MSQIDFPPEEAQIPVYNYLFLIYSLHHFKSLMRLTDRDQVTMSIFLVALPSTT